jgi:hypothetical protein
MGHGEQRYALAIGAHIGVTEATNQLPVPKYANASSDRG